VFPGSYPFAGIFVVKLAPCPCGALEWHCIQFAPSPGDPVFPPGDPVELELETDGKEKIARIIVIAIKR